MSEFCGTLTTNPSIAEKCNEGYLKGLFLSYKKVPSVTPESLKLIATLDDMQEEDLADGRLFALRLDKEITAVTTEVTYEEDDNGDPSETNRMVKAGEYGIFTSPCTDAALLQNKQHKRIYAWLVYSTGLVKGKKTAAGNTEQFRCSLGFRKLPGALGAGAKIVAKFWHEEETGNEIGIIPTDYDLDTAVENNVKTINFVEVDKSLTTLTVKATDLCGNSITTLDTVGAGQFVLINTTDSAPIVVTGITLTGDEYELAFIAQTEADAYQLYYTAPSVNGEKVEVLAENALVGTLNA